MNELQYAIGLDIGSSGVKTVFGSFDGDSVSVISSHEASYDTQFDSTSKGVITNAPNTINTINEALQILTEGYEGESEFLLNINICQDDIFTEESKAEYNKQGSKFEITQQVLQHLNDLNSQNYIAKSTDRDESTTLHSLPLDFYRDEELIEKNPGGTTGNKLSCTFTNINVLSDNYDTYRKHLDKVRIEPKNKNPYLRIDSVIYSPLADAISILSDEDKREGVILINVGDTFTTATYYKQNAPRKFVQLPFGSNLISVDISKKLDVSIKEARKLQYACMSRKSTQIEINEILTLVQQNGLPSKRFLEKNIVQVAEWRLREIAALINCSLDISQQPKNGIILTGGIANLPSLKSIIKKEFNTEVVRIANATQNVLGMSPSEVSNPKFSVATGLMLSSFVSIDRRMENLALNRSARKAKTSEGWTVAKTIKKMFENDDLKQGYGE